MITPLGLDRLTDRLEKQGKAAFVRTLKTVYTKMATQYLNGNDIKPDKDLIKSALQQYHIKTQISIAEWQYNDLERLNKKALQLGMYERLLSLIRAWVLINTGASITSISNTSLEIVRKIIATGQEQGFGAKKIAALIKQEGGSEFTKYRSEVIARTEGTRAASKGADFGAEQWEKITGQRKWKGWSASSDSRTRDTHLAMVGSMPIPGDDDFIVGGKPMDGPGDPKGGASECVNCRCRKYWMSERLARRILSGEVIR